MKIVTNSLGKKFGREWIFRDLNLQLGLNKSYAVTGPNGSGKSTLLQILAGFVPPTHGDITYSDDDNEIPGESWYKHLTIAAPYLELIEEFTLRESIAFHTKFKSFRENIGLHEFAELIMLNNSLDKEIRYFSSGMKQRVKLGLALYSNCEVLMLDEPTANLDKDGIIWYKNHIAKNMENRITIICSNQTYEYDFCDKIIAIK